MYWNTSRHRHPLIGENPSLNYLPTVSNEFRVTDTPAHCLGYRLALPRNLLRKRSQYVAYKRGGILSGAPKTEGLPLPVPDQSGDPWSLRGSLYV